MFDLYLRHMRLATAAGVHIIPKHHLALHLWDRAAVTGNPKEFANWYDEHLNATLAHGSHHYPVSIIIITEAAHGGGPW